MNSKKISVEVVEFVQNYFFMLILAIILFGFSAFKAMEKPKALTSAWFELYNPNGPVPESESGQFIGAMLPNPPPIPKDEDECTQKNLADPCLVHLNLNGNSPASLLGLSVDEVTNLPTNPASINTESSDDGYARKWKEVD